MKNKFPTKIEFNYVPVGNQNIFYYQEPKRIKIIFLGKKKKFL